VARPATQIKRNFRCTNWFCGVLIVAIFGNLTHMSLDDLLPFLSSRDGALELFNLKRLPQVTLYFRKGQLHCVHLGNKPIDALQARSVIGELISARKGSFEFIPGAMAKSCPDVLDWPVDRILISITTTFDEYAQVADRLPHADTLFKLTHITVPDDTRLSDFWKRAHIYLQEGVSAQQLANKLGMPVDHTRFYLLKLQQLGAVAAGRAHKTQRQERRAGVAARLLGSLKKRFFGEGGAWSH